VRVRRSRVAAGALTFVLFVLVLAVEGRSTLLGLALVVRAANLEGVARHLADLTVVPVREHATQIPLGDSTAPAAVYSPDGSPRHSVLLIPGLHPAGIADERLVTLARTLAEANVTVVTAAIPGVTAFDITPRLTDHIETAALWLADDAALAPAGRIGLIGVSFSGGLAVVAAGRSSLAGRLRYVLSLGGHDDLERTLEYLCGCGSPCPGCDDEPPAPHDYGAAVVLLNVADRVVPPEQVPALREAVRRYLDASYLARTDPGGAEREFLAIRTSASEFPEPSATLLGYLAARDISRLGPIVLPHMRTMARAPSLSPARSPAPSVPLLLLHGRRDNVIPATEARHLATRVEGHVPVRLLVTGLISHATADEPVSVGDVLALARFWGDLLER
jgi:dienelactone hydrolase